jgi:transcriptional regulator with XRE-family HTH domain
MKTREELIHSEAYWMVKIQNDLYSKVEEYMLNNGLNRTQMAEKLGVTKGYLSQVLNGDFNHKISKLVELSLAINLAPVIEFKDLDQYIFEDKNRVKPITLAELTAKPIVMTFQSRDTVRVIKTQGKSEVFDSQSSFGLLDSEWQLEGKEDLLCSF